MDETKQPHLATKDGDCRIVGMGGSAGSLEAFAEFFSQVSAETGMAFILVPHLEPTHKGMMPELLSRHTKMPVVEVQDGMLIEPNHVYIIPPNADLSILHGRLQVLEPTAPRGLRLPIDSFFRHLAMDQRENAVAVVLSGTGSDGALGVKAIKEKGGRVMVQEPSSAQYDGMPRSAINASQVDCIAAPKDLPAKLIEIAGSFPQAFLSEPIPSQESSNALQKLFVLLRALSDNDFSCYKISTVSRRIERRMVIHQFDRLESYVRYLQENPQEVELLFKELLIGVTHFFRDAPLYDYLREQAFPKLFEERRNDQQGNQEKAYPLRIWNPACATGEESYSLAITLKECMERQAPFANAERADGFRAFQIFATDLDKEAIEKARAGRYPKSIAADVSPERLSRYFVAEDGGYRIASKIRELVVFAPQNILVDPPFTKMDIVCCRNFMIYVNSQTQNKLMPLMHYALNPGGLLILGTAESLGAFEHLFTPLNQKWKVFQRSEISQRLVLEMPVCVPQKKRVAIPTTEKVKIPIMDQIYAAQRVLLDCYGPPSVMVNADGDIVYINGRTGNYLEPSSGKVNINLFAMAREGLREPIATALRNAGIQKRTVFVREVQVKTDIDYKPVNLTVMPLFEPGELRGMFLVVFEDYRAGGRSEPVAATADSPVAGDSEIEAELQRTRARLQAAVEEMGATQEELRSANEELQSGNEELQSSNEELTSSKEELQSLNEEMQMVNAELQMKNEQLSLSNDDMKNLLNGTEIATIFLDNDLAVKRFTASASSVVHLFASDIGRPLSHFATNLKYDHLVQDCRATLETLLPKDLQVETADGRWYNMRILPYRTNNNVIDGVVATFSEITLLKQAEAQLEQSRDYAKSIIATIREPFLVLDEGLRVVSASRSFYSKFQVDPPQTEGRRVYELGDGQWNIPALRQLLEEILVKNNEFQDFRVEHDFPKIGLKVLMLNARQIEQNDRREKLVLLAMEEVTPSAETNRPSA